MYAIIDIGSNTIRLNVYQVEEDGAIHSIFQSKETAGLAGYVRHGVLSDSGILVACRTLAAYRALLAGEPGALDRPPEGLELHQVTLPPAEELEYVLLDLDGDGGAELVVQMVAQPQQFNAVFHYGDGELSCWQYDIVEMSCRDYPLEDGAMVRQYDTGTGPNRYSHLYTVFRYLPDGETEECASLAVHQDTQEDGTEVFTYLVDDAEVDQDTFAAEFEELVGSRLLSLEDWIPATERPG